MAMLLPSLPILPYSNRAVYLEGHSLSYRESLLKIGLFLMGFFMFKVTDLVASYDDLLPEPADRAGNRPAASS